jgi:hypothetical protein
MRADDALDKAHSILLKVPLLRNQKIAAEHSVLAVQGTLVALPQLVLAVLSCLPCCYSYVA